MMTTVVFVPAQAFAFCQVWLISIAVDIVQMNRARTIAKVGVGVCVDSSTTACLLTHHPGVVEGPVIVTHCAPRSLEVDLYPALAGMVSIHQADGAIS